MPASRFSIGLFAAAWLAAGSLLAAEKQDKAGIEFFEKHIRPVLVSKCYQCHAATSREIKGGLVLDTREGTRKGGESGPAIVPGNLDDSILIEALKHEGLEMPPDEKLSDDVIAKFEQWVKMGAPDPRDGKAVAAKREIDFNKAREFWAFQAIKRPAVPKVADAAWPRNDVDRFVLAKLEEKQIKPVADADALALVRRIYFDLTGLPPTPEEVDEFVLQFSSSPHNAVSKLADKLLASPRFGERWGRHWLDVVRYAESTGMERNFTYPQAWRYRDYVIASFNADKPFDQFVREQVAGDLLPASSPQQRREQVVATGFLAMGPKGLNETNKEIFAMDLVDEQVDTTFRAFMGLTAGCARCHDHKFDPIPSKEYYALAGIFKSTDTFYGTPAIQGNRNGGRLIAMADGEVSPFTPEAKDGKRGGKGKNSSKGPSAEDLKKDLREAENKLADIKRKLDSTSDEKKKLKGAKLVKELENEVARLREQYQAAQNGGKGNATAADNAPPKSNELLMAVLDGKSPGDTELRVRGDANDKGDKIPRGFLTIGTVGKQPKIGSGSGRLELADYLTQADNPLTARVAANRVWQHLFGRGIVATVDNFGVQSEAPTHPELLDYLATELVDHNWSIKHLVRTIVTSRTYQLAAVGNAKAEKVDPSNHLLWRARHRRLEGEAIRDAMLATSGQLDLAPPSAGSVVAQVGDGDIGRGLNVSQFAVAGNWRSVYLPILRLAVPDMLQVFDFPEPSNISGQRDVTTVATQALYVMNNDFVIEQARHFADRVVKESPSDDAARLDRAYRLALGRKPSADEQKESLQFVKQMYDSLRSDGRTDSNATSKSWTALCQALLASAEFRYLE
jgi:hypothetical protein